MYFKIGYLLGLNRVFEAFERCLNTQASQQPPSLTAGGHSVESAKKKKENLLSLVTEELIESTPKRRSNCHRIQPVATRLNVLKRRKKIFSLSLQKS